MLCLFFLITLFVLERQISRAVIWLDSAKYGVLECPCGSSIRYSLVQPRIYLLPVMSWAGMSLLPLLCDFALLVLMCPRVQEKCQPRDDAGYDEDRYDIR